MWQEVLLDQNDKLGEQKTSRAAKSNQMKAVESNKNRQDSPNKHIGKQPDVTSQVPEVSVI